MKKRLWQIFGPVIVAFLALLILLFAPLNYSHFSVKDEKSCGCVEFHYF